MSLFVLAAIAINQAHGQSVTVETERAKLKGRWELVQWERRGFQGPPRIDSQYEFFMDGTYQITSSEGKVYPKRKYELHVDANPKQMDWFVTIQRADKSVKEVTVKEIYSIEGNRLTICKAVPLNGPRPTVFDSKPENDVFVFKRILLSDAEVERKRKQAAKDALQSAAWQGLCPMASNKFKGEVSVDFHQHSWTRTVDKKHWQDLLNLRDIRELRLRGCTGVGNGEMEHVAKLTTLESLDLHSTEVGDTGLARLNSLKNLESLDLSFTSVSDVGLATIAGMEKLKTVVLQGTLVTKKGVEGLRSTRKDLEIDWPRPYTESQQRAAASLSRLGLEIADGTDRAVQPTIVTCQINIPSYVAIGDRAIVSKRAATVPKTRKSRVPSGYAMSPDPMAVGGYLAKLPAPTSVTVADVRMDDTVFLCMRGIQGLVQLDLRSTAVTDAGLAELNRHKSLNVLDMSCARRITDKGVANLASLTNLKKLDLTGIALTPDGVTSLLKLGQLKVLAIDRMALNPDLKLKFRQNGVELRLQ